MSGNCLLIFILVFVRAAIIFFFALSLSVVVDRGASVLVLAGAYEKKELFKESEALRARRIRAEKNELALQEGYD